MKETYFLFGEDAVRAYVENNDINDVVQGYEGNEFGYGLFMFIEGETSPLQLLCEYHGWNDYILISEAEYEKL